jgi:hypothetical protein
MVRFLSVSSNFDKVQLGLSAIAMPKAVQTREFGGTRPLR